MIEASFITDSSGTLASYKYLGAGQIVTESTAGATLSYLDSTDSNVTGLVGGHEPTLDV